MSAAPDFRLYHGNDLAVLAAVLAAELARPCERLGLLQPDTVLIPQPAMKRWLQQELAQRHGVAANLQFLTPGEFVRDALRANLGGDDAALADAATLRWRLWQALRDPPLVQDARFAALRPMLQAADGARAAWALAGELAVAFEKYQAWRRDWLRAWDRGAERDDWQAELWRRATRGLSHRGARLDAWFARFGPEGEIPQGLPPRVFAFACQNVSPDVLRVIAGSARAGTLHFFFVSPVEGWWGDLQTAREAGFAADEEAPLLRANGAAGRDFVRLLFADEAAAPAFEIPIYAPPDPAVRSGLLHDLQRDLLARRPPGAAPRRRFDAARDPDPSLQFHACATRLREVQVLHDHLRALLEAPPRDGVAPLQPRDIAVLAPDIDAYAPIVRAVFGAPDANPIPHAIADASAARTQPLAAAFLQWLALPRSRFGAEEVVALLALPATRQRLGLEAADETRLRGWLAAAGARWGLDAAHRAALGAPEERAYSWQWALDRLLLGHATGQGATLAGVAPWPELEGGDLERLDALLRALRTLARLQRELAQPHPAGAWQHLLSRALEDLLPEQPEDAGDRRALEHLRATVEAFAKEAARAGIEDDIDPAVVEAWFEHALGESDARQPFLTGAVTFARMVPMRLIPFRVICVLGLDDGAFPRQESGGGLNRLAQTLGTPQRRVGDRSLREDDRALFLQLFAAATDTFHLSWIGRDAQSGETLPPSVVVSELLDVAAQAYADPAAARATLVVQHPLQPFAPQAFGVGDARRFSYRAQWRVEARGASEAPPPFAPQSLAEAPPALREIELAGLRADLQHPPRAFLRHGLGVALDAGEERLPEDEPFDDDGLRLHRLRERLFAALIEHEEPPGAEALFERLLAEGLVAPGAAGRREVRRWRDRVLASARDWRGLVRGAPRRLAFALPLGETRLLGTLAPVHASGLLQFRAGKPHGKARIDLALDRLAWSALGESAPVHRLHLGERPVALPPLPRAAAENALQRLLDLQALMRREALPLMPKAAWAFVDCLQQRGDEGAAFAAASKAWCEGDGAEGEDRWTRLALRGADPFAPGNDAQRERFAQLARELFDALHEAGGAP